MPSRLLPTKRKKARRHVTTQGRVVYDRSPHSFSARDLERIARSISRSIAGNLGSYQDDPGAALDFVQAVEVALVEGLLAILQNRSYNAVEVGLALVSRMQSLIFRVEGLLIRSVADELKDSVQALFFGGTNASS